MFDSFKKDINLIKSFLITNLRIFFLFIHLHVYHRLLSMYIAPSCLPNLIWVRFSFVILCVVHKLKRTPVLLTLLKVKTIK